VAEYIPEGAEVFGEAHNPNTQGVILELHRLVCIFLASKAFAGLRDGATPAIDLIDRIQAPEQEEVTRILLSVSVTARVIDDRKLGWFDHAGNCGTLSEGNTDQQLAFREACNKIIHASKVRFDVEQDAHGQSYVTPTMYFYGTRHNGVEWKAVLDVLEYTKQYVRCLPAY
jgi:hypothetical protein